MYDYYSGTMVDKEYAADSEFDDSIKIGRDFYTEGGFVARPYGPGMPGRYGMPGMMPGYGMYLRRGRRFKDINFGNLYLGQPKMSFFDTRKMLKNSLRAKYPRMSELKINIRSTAEALIKHPFRNTVANISYNPIVVDMATKKYKKYY